MHEYLQIRRVIQKILILVFMSLIASAVSFSQTQLVSAGTSYDGSKIFLTFTANMDDPTGRESAFTIYLNGSPVDPWNYATAANANPKVIEIRMVTAITSGQTVLISGDGNSIIDATYSNITSFTNQTVYNNRNQSYGAIDYSSEVINNVNNSMEYTVGANWGGTVNQISGNSISLSSIIPSFGSPSVTVRIRVKGEATEQTHTITARVATPTAHTINYTTAQTGEVSPVTEEYATNNTFSSSLTTGSGSAITLTPGTNLWFRTKATGATFASTGIQLTVASRPVTPSDFTISYSLETTVENATATDEYSWDGTNWTTGTNASIDLSPNNNGGSVKILYRRTKATGASFASNSSTGLSVSTRPATPTFDIDYTNERTNSTVSTSYEYGTTSDLSGSTAGTGAYISLTPGTNMYFRKLATGGAFKSAIQTLIVSSRPATPSDFSISYSLETTVENATATDEYSWDGTNWTTGTNATIALSPNNNGGAIKTLYKRTKATGAAFASSSSSGLNIPTRPSTPSDFTISYTNETTIENAATTDEYSWDGTNWSTGTNSAIVLSPNNNGGAVKNLYRRTKSTGSSFSSNSSGGLNIPTRPVSPTAGDGSGTTVNVAQANGLVGTKITAQIGLKVRILQSDAATIRVAEEIGTPAGKDFSTAIFGDIVKAYLAATGGSFRSPDHSVTLDVSNCKLGPPSVTSAITKSTNEIELTFNQTLAANTPQNSDFNISLNGGSTWGTIPTGVSISGSSALLTFAVSTFNGGQTINLSYTQSGGNELQNSGGEKVQNIATASSQSITNKLPNGTLNYSNENITGLANGSQEYNINGGGWNAVTSVTLDISGSIPSAGNPTINVVIRNSTTTTAMQTISIIARPSTLSFAIDYSNEQTSTIVSSSYEYGTLSDLSSSTIGTGSVVLLTLGTNLYFRQVAVANTSFKSAIQTLTISTRQATPAFTIDYINEQTSTTVSNSYEYGTNANLAGSTIGSGVVVTLTPGTDIYFRKLATAGAFKSAIQTLTVPARSTTPSFGIDYVNEQTSTIVTNGYEYGTTSDLSVPVTGSDAVVTLTPGTNVYFRKLAIANTSFKSAIQTLTVPSRSATPAFSIDYVNEQTASSVSNSYEYGTASNLAGSTIGSGAFAPLIPGTNMYFRQIAVANTSFKSSIQTLTVSGRAAAPIDFSISYLNETTNENIASTDEYSWDGTTWISGTNNAVLLSPNNNGGAIKTLYRRTKATETAFSSNPSTGLNIPTRPAAPTSGDGSGTTIKAEKITLTPGTKITAQANINLRILQSDNITVRIASEAGTASGKHFSNARTTDKLKAKLSSTGTSFASSEFEITLDNSNCIDISEPIMSLQTNTNILTKNVTLGANITSDGGSSIIQRGVVWSTSSLTPTIALATKSLHSINSTGIFTINVPNLIAGTKYYFRAFASNAVNTSYSPVDSFMTLSAPMAITGMAENITTTSAKLNGSINSNGLTTSDSATIIFYWGPTESYGNSTNLGKVKTNTNINFSLDISNLLPDNIYNYKVEAIKDSTTISGGNLSFRTLKNATPPFVLTNEATNIGRKATLNGIVNANNLITQVYFEYGFNTEYSNKVLLNQQVTGNNNTNVSLIIDIESNKTYHFRLKALNNAGITYSEDRTFSSSSVNISVNQSSLNFADLGYKSSPVTQSITITNNSPYFDATINNITLNTPRGIFEYSGSTPFSIDSNSSATIPIKFLPDSVGEYSGTIILSNNSNNNFRLEIPITGNVVSTTVTAVNNSFNFGERGYKADPKDTVIKIRNMGLYKLKVLGFGFSNNTDNPFSVITQPGDIVNAGAEYPVTVRFTPFDTGAAVLPITNNLTILTNAVPNSLSGIVLNATMKRTQINIIASTPTDTIKPDTTTYMSDSASVIKLIAQFGVPNGGQPFTVFGTVPDGYSGDWILNGNSLKKSDKKYFNSTIKSVVINPGQTYSFVLSYIPRNQGIVEVPVIITTSDPLIPSKTIIFRSVIVGDPVLICNTQTISIGNMKFGSYLDTTIIIKNDGNLYLQLSQKTIIGSNSNNFGIIQGADSLLLPLKQSSSFKVRFDPKLPIGNKTAQIFITTNDRNHSSYSINLDLIVISPIISTDIQSLNWSGAKIGSVYDTTILVKNERNDTLIISQIYVDGFYYSNFELLNTLTYPLVINPGSQKSVKLRYKPNTDESIYGRVVFLSNDLSRQYAYIPFRSQARFDSTNLPSDSMAFRNSSTPISTNVSSEAITKYTLYQNYPNPFNPTTEITFDLPKENIVTLEIYDISGRKIRTLLNDQIMNSGQFNIMWDGKNDLGKSMTTGIYFLKLKTNDFVDTKKMILTK